MCEITPMALVAAFNAFLVFVALCIAHANNNSATRTVELLTKLLAQKESEDGDDDEYAQMLNAVGPTGPMGAQGPKGEKGEPGRDAVCVCGPTPMLPDGWRRAYLDGNDDLCGEEKIACVSVKTKTEPQIHVDPGLSQVWSDALEARAKGDETDVNDADDEDVDDEDDDDE